MKRGYRLTTTQQVFEDIKRTVIFRRTLINFTSNIKILKYLSVTIFTNTNANNPLIQIEEHYLALCI